MRIETGMLKKALDTVKSISKETGVLCNIKDNMLTLYANNGEIKVIKKLPVIEEDREFALDSNAIAVLHALPEGEANFVFEDDKVHVSIGRVKQIIVLPIIKLTMINEEEKIISSFKLDEEIVSKIARVTYACAEDDVRPILRGVQFDCEKGRVVALDGIKVGIQNIPELICTSEVQSPNFVLKGTNLSMLKELTGQIAVENNIGWVKFYSNDENLAISIAKMEGEYLNLQPILTTKGELEATFNTSELIGALKRIEITNIGERESLVALKLDNSGIQILNKNNTYSYEETLQMSSVNFDKEIKIAFNNRLLLQAVQNMKAEDIKVYFNSPSNPVFMENEGAIAIVLPVRINN